MALFVFTPTHSDKATFYGGEDSRVKRYVGTGSAGDYVTGGVVVTPALIDSTLPAGATIVDILVQSVSKDGVNLFAYDEVTETILSFNAIGTEETAAVDLSDIAKSFRMVAFVNTEQ